MKNQEIREAAKKEGVNLWQIADELGIRDTAFSRVLRYELSAEKKVEILGIIAKLGKERER